MSDERESTGYSYSGVCDLKIKFVYCTTGLITRKNIHILISRKNSRKLDRVL